MKETRRMIKLMDDLFQGNPWIDVNISKSLKKINAKQAALHPLTGRNSIWEIVNHLIKWRLNVLQRVNGKVIKTPSDNYFSSIKDTSATRWKKTLNQLRDSQSEWTNFLKKLKEEDLSKIYPDNKMTYYEHIHGIIQHDAYHLGQVVLLAKLV